MKIEILIPSEGLRYESLPTEVADIDRVHAAQQIARDMHNGNPVSIQTERGTVIIAAALMKTAVVHILW